MESADNQTPVPLANSRNVATELRVLAGLSCLVFIPLAIATLFDRDLPGLYLLVLPAAALALAHRIDHVTPDSAAVLHSERLEIPRVADKPLVLAWSDVTSIRWPGYDGRARVRLVQKDAEQRVQHVLIDLQDVSLANRLVLIEYLHRAGADVEQTNWEAFCQKQALPLAERLEGRHGAGAEATTATPSWLRSIEQYPFLCGLLSPILLGAILKKVVSRTIYWTMALIVATSALINIRLVWG